MGGYYICYTLILLIIKLVIESHYDQISVFTTEDLQALMISGYCTYLDVLITPSGSFGISTMWFLYCGAVAMVILFLIRRWIFDQITIAIIGTVSLFAIVTNYISSTPVVPRIFFQALPFLYIGMIIHRYEKNIKQHRLTWNTTFIIVCMALSVITLYAEQFLSTSAKEVYLSTPVLVVTIFVLCIKYPDIEWKTTSRLPVKATMDIYVWHRLLYALLVLFACDFKPLSAIAVFLICVVLFSTCRILVENRKVVINDIRKDDMVNKRTRKQ